MRNVIKMDLYRLSRSRSIRLGLILTAVICFAAAALTRGFAELMNIAINSDPEFTQDAAEMIAMLPMLGWTNEVDIGLVIMQYSGILTLVIASVMSVIFINDEQLAGFGKNYLGQLGDKAYSVVSKLISTSLIHALVILISTITATLAGLLFYGCSLSTLNAGNLALALFLRLLMYLSINAILVFLCLLTRSRSAPMILSVVFGIGAGQLAYGILTSGLDMVVSRISGGNLHMPALEGLLPDGVDRMLNAGFYMEPYSDLIVRTLIVAAVYITVFALSAIAIVRKRDVR